MGENPSHFQDGEDSVTVMLKGRSVKMQPDHPVENITWWSAVEYLNQRPKKAGLPPAYDLSEIKWKDGTRAEDGTWEPASDEEAMKLRINAPNGDIYQAEGFRFSTEAEWEYVYRNLGKSKGEYPHDISATELADFACVGGTQTRAVGTAAKCFQVNGNFFHDLIGNVSKWTHDGWSGSLEGGVNPQGPQLPLAGLYRVVRGGGWNSESRFLRSASHYGGSPSLRDSSVGLRPVRTLR